MAQDDLELLAFGNYGHYTSMQIRRGGARGLDLHLQRLHTNALEMFGCAAGPDRILEAIRHAVPMSGNCSVRVTLFSRDLRRVVAGEAVEPDIMVSVTPAADEDTTPMRVLPVHYEREMPQVKHLATYGLLRQRRAARTAGYDDALFVDGADRVSEGSTWNICFHDGQEWVWPDASALEGIALQLLRSAMQEAGWAVRTSPIAASEVRQFTGAFATNSVSHARPVSGVGDHSLATSTRDKRLLDELFASVPWQSLS